MWFYLTLRFLRANFTFLCSCSSPGNSLFPLAPPSFRVGWTVVCSFLQADALHWNLAQKHANHQPNNTLPLRFSSWKYRLGRRCLYCKHGIVFCFVFWIKLHLHYVLLALIKSVIYYAVVHVNYEYHLMLVVHRHVRWNCFFSGQHHTHLLFVVGDNYHRHLLKWYSIK